MSQEKTGVDAFEGEDFLPAGYEAPKQVTGYMSFEDGSNKFLILGAAVVGWMYWNTDKKPIRSKVEFKDMPKDIQLDKDGKPTRIIHFWAFPVWNFEDKRVQVLELTQATIQRGIISLRENEDWGTPIMTYAINVTKEGKELTTKYTVQPSPAKEIAPEIKSAWEETKTKGFDLQRLFVGGNVFSPEEAKK